jgi:hypothetical protein
VRTAICSVIGIVCALGQARATPYETFIDVDDEADLQDLFAAGVLTEDTFNELIDLLGRGVDLNRADRNELYTLPNLTFEDVDAIIAYRELNGRINDPAELVGTGALSEQKLFAIASFIIVKERGTSPLAARGFARVMTRMSRRDFNPSPPQDPLVPPFGLRARVTVMQYLTLGVVVATTRMRVGAPVFDPARNALVADARSNQAHIPKIYARWEDDNITAVVGSFRAGFGQRLVFDNSIAYSPNGFYRDDQLFFSQDLTSTCKESAGELNVSPCTTRNEYVTPDFVWRNGLFGAGFGAKRLELTSGWLQTFGFASASRRSIYQYELVNRDTCDDPHDDANPGCTAPNVFVRPEGPLLTPTSRHSFVTLPDVFQEQLVGGNVAYFADRRSSVGLTAYGGVMKNLVSGVDLDFQEWSRFPFGRKYGAVGANFSYGRDWLDIFGEAAASFDAMGRQDPAFTPARGGGGPAAILRATATRKREELEVVARYYSTDYLNPYARPISQPDQFEGMRARDEAGTRVRYIRTGKDLTIRALADLWFNPSNIHGPKLDTYVRANVRTSPVLWLGLWERYQDKDLRRGGHDQCFEVSNETDETGETIPCGGRQITTMARAMYVPSRKLSATLQLQHQLLDDNTRMELRTKFRQDVAAWFIAYYRPTKDIRMRVRVRYLDESIHDNTHLERSVAALVDSVFRVRRRDMFRVRVDGKFWLDKRMSTSLRVPSPELGLWLFYEARI